MIQYKTTICSRQCCTERSSINMMKKMKTAVSLLLYSSLFSFLSLVSCTTTIPLQAELLLLLILKHIKFRVTSTCVLRYVIKNKDGFKLQTKLYSFEVVDLQRELDERGNSFITLFEKNSICLHTFAQESLNDLCGA